MLPGIPPALLPLITDTIHPGLDAIRRALETVASPHLAYDTILIGGTNGKGSTQAFLESLLRAQGLRVGVFTSPSLTDFCGHMRIDGQVIDPQTLAACAQAYIAAGGGPLTAFEMATLLAFYGFRQARVDVALIEVGMGGTGDSTNICDPQLSVITSLGLDHQRFLGETLDKIAGHKLGIARPGRPLFIGATGAGRVALERRLPSHSGPIRFLGRDFGYLSRKEGMELWHDPPGARRAQHLDGVELHLAGAHQGENAALAWAAAQAYLGGRQLALKDDVARAALAKTRLFGRLSRVGRIFIDGAHNAQGARALAQAMPRVIGDDIHLILGIFRDKDVMSIVKKLAPRAKKVTCVPLTTKRGMPPEDLAAVVRGLFPRLPCAVAPNLAAALAASEDGKAVLIAGSLNLATQYDLLISGAMPQAEVSHGPMDSED